MKGKITKLLFSVITCYLLALTTYAKDFNYYDNLEGVDSLKKSDSITQAINNEGVENQNYLDFLRLKPRIGIGLGTLTFLGDVANNYKDQHFTVSRIAYDLKLSNRLNDFLDLDFYFQGGKVAANEQSLTRNLNFESSIKIGGARLSYNFHHFLNKKRRIEPYLSTGIEILEFVSKTDLFDKNGNRYHYWSNGSIMSKPENDPEAYSAVILQRDYSYETDLRKLNLDGFGNYAERSLSIPIGAGFKMQLTDELTFQFGTSLHYSFTDLIDNVSSDGKNERKGNKGMDKLLYTTFSLNYIIPFFRKNDFLYEFPKSKDEFYELQNGDEDNDGVVDLEDDCLGTSPYATVDARGCPLDNDKDGVPDFRDEELESAPGAIVDEFGVTLTDEKLAEIERNKFKNAKYNIMRSSFKGFQEKKSSNSTYPTTEEYYLTIPQDQSKGKETVLLNQPDLITKSENGNISYQLGPFNNTKEAAKRKSEIQNQGIQSSKLQTSDGTTIEENGEEIGASKNTPANKTVFRVQIGAFSKSVPLERFSGLPNVIGIKGDDGLVRYMTGAFEKLSDAANHKVQISFKGYEETFIVAYRNGKKISLKQAGANFTEESGKDESYVEPAPIIISKESVKFRIKLGAYELGVPKHIMEALFKLKNVKIMREDGASHYYYGIYDSHDEAQEALKEAQKTGVKEAFIVGDFDGNIIDEKEALRLISD